MISSAFFRVSREQRGDSRVAIQSGIISKASSGSDLTGGQMEKQEFPGPIFMNHLSFQLRDFEEKVMSIEHCQKRL